MRITRPLRPLHATAPRRASNVGLLSVGSERRTRPNLRELCDEVLASHRAANGCDLFSDSDRAAARALFNTVVPNAAA